MSRYKGDFDTVSGHIDSLSGGVYENLRLHRMKKIMFSFYHHKVEIRSFPTMYNTGVCSLGRNGPKQCFSPKKVV